MKSVKTISIQKYNSFGEILDSWKSNDHPAILMEERDEQISISYQQLREKIVSRIQTLSAAGPERSLQIISAEASEEMIIDLFAYVISGYPVLMADPKLPAPVIEGTRKSAEKNLPLPETGIEGQILFYTSGTSSRSRCVILTSQSLSCSAWSGQSMLACGPEDVILCLLPLSHVFGFVCSMLWGLCYGAAIALGRGLRHLMDDCMYFHPTILPAVPSIAGAFDRMNLFNPELRVLLIGAAPCGEALLESIHRKGIDVYFGYGLTETSSGIAITQDLDEPAAMYACPGADIRIEETGEISVSTPCMMQGYLGEPSPLVNGRLMTGDLGRFDEKGRLHIEGRRKDMLVMPDGTKIFCPEYEAILMERLETDAIAVAELRNRAVLVIEDAVLAHDVDHVTAGPGPQQDSEQNPYADQTSTFRKKAEDTIRHFNLDRSRSQQIADIIYLRGKLPRTAVGKLQRWKLQEILNSEAYTF